VDVDGILVTAIALYGLNDEAYESSVHRSLSELSPVFDHAEYGKYLVLGGDLNILAGAPRYRGHIALDRIKAYGLIDCLEQGLAPDRYQDRVRRAEMDKCRCGRKEDCTHTRTFFDRRRPDIPYQDDYLFASPALARGDLLEERGREVRTAGDPLDVQEASVHRPGDLPQFFQMLDAPKDPHVTGAVDGGLDPDGPTFLQVQLDAGVLVGDRHGRLRALGEDSGLEHPPWWSGVGEDHLDLPGPAHPQVGRGSRTRRRPGPAGGRAPG